MGVKGESFVSLSNCIIRKLKVVFGICHESLIYRYELSVTLEMWSKEGDPLQKYDRMKGNMSLNIVAVYGSLRSGFDNHELLLNSQPIGKGWLTGYRMGNFGNFPGVIFTHEDNQRVRVEWYKVTDSTLEAMDRLEEYDPNAPDSSLFIRKKVQSPYGKGWIYVYNQPFHDVDVIEYGDWERAAIHPVVHREIPVV